MSQEEEQSSGTTLTDGAPRTTNGIDYCPEETEMSHMCEINQARNDRQLLVEQSLKYADDLVRVYEEEKRKRKNLEKANRQLIAEIAAHHQAERELVKAHQELDQRVRERTEALSKANDRLRLEIAQRKAAEEKTRASLQEKEVLLKEIHHRVKNNLQIISSLLSLQAAQVDDERVVGALKDSQGRIRSMALIHEQLYRSANLSRIDFAAYVRDLVHALLQTLPDQTSSVKITSRVDEAFLDVARALPCSLVINELVTNALKHAFPDARDGEIRIEFSRQDDEHYSFTVADNGIGLPEGLDYRNSPSLGLRLVANLVQLQLGGSLNVNREGGTAFQIDFQCPSGC